jgi:flagellar basal-body rod modification protein FlgD
MTSASVMSSTVTSLPQGTQLPSATAKANSATGASTLSQNDFLTLLTTQLEHQDPLNPQSPSDFAAELAQFTTASGVQNLNTAFGTSGGIQAVGLVGKSVSVAGNQLVLGSSGSAQGAFSLSAAAKDVSVTIANASGSVVATVDLGAMAAGSQSFTWNGQGTNGTALPAGTYSYAIKATPASGNGAVSVTPYAVAPVTSVVLSGQSGPMLNLGGGLSPVALSAVQQIF